MKTLLLFALYIAASAQSAQSILCKSAATAIHCVLHQRYCLCEETFWLQGVTEPCDCEEGWKCANYSSSKGVKNREECCDTEALNGRRWNIRFMWKGTLHLRFFMAGRYIVLLWSHQRHNIFFNPCNLQWGRDWSTDLLQTSFIFMTGCLKALSLLKRRCAPLPLSLSLCCWDHLYTELVLDWWLCALAVHRQTCLVTLLAPGTTQSRRTTLGWLHRSSPGKEVQVFVLLFRTETLWKLLLQRRKLSLFEKASQQTWRSPALRVETSASAGSAKRQVQQQQQQQQHLHTQAAVKAT